MASKEIESLIESRDTKPYWVRTDLYNIGRPNYSPLSIDFAIGHLRSKKEITNLTGRYNDKELSSIFKVAGKYELKLPLEESKPNKKGSLLKTIVGFSIGFPRGVIESSFILPTYLRKHVGYFDFGGSEDNCEFSNEMDSFREGYKLGYLSSFVGPGLFPIMLCASVYHSLYGSSPDLMNHLIWTQASLNVASLVCEIGRKIYSSHELKLAEISTQHF